MAKTVLAIVAVAFTLVLAVFLVSVAVKQDLFYTFLLWVGWLIVLPFVILFKKERKTK